MKKINLAITGCLGRMGQQLIKSCKKIEILKLFLLQKTETSRKKLMVLSLKNTLNAFKRASIIIDFTVPRCTMQVLKIASKLKKRVVIGTTGFSKKEENLIKKYSKKIPILESWKYEFRCKSFDVFDRDSF